MSILRTVQLEAPRLDGQVAVLGKLSSDGLRVFIQSLGESALFDVIAGDEGHSLVEEQRFGGGLTTAFDFKPPQHDNLLPELGLVFAESRIAEQRSLNFISRYHLDLGEMFGKLKVSETYSLSYSPSGYLLAAGGIVNVLKGPLLGGDSASSEFLSTGSVYVYDLTSASGPALILGGPIFYSRQSRHNGGSIYKLVQGNEESLESPLLKAGYRHLGPVTVISFTPGNRHLLIACSSGENWVLDVQTGLLFPFGSLVEDSGLLEKWPTRDFVLSGKSGCIGMLSGLSAVPVLDVRGRRLSVIETGLDEVVSGAFSADGKSLYLASHDSIELWQLDGLPGKVSSVHEPFLAGQWRLPEGNILDLGAVFDVVYVLYAR